MRELSLFSGAGGGLLGTKLLGWVHCGYVEFNDYCQRIIAQRIEDGILDSAPIFGDIKAFISEGYADAYQGLVDVVTAGFPCQPFSVAGKRAGENDSQNMWPETVDVIRRVRPRFALLENVPGLLAHEYGQQIFRDLAKSGYESRWRVLSAAELGAPHKRDRLWVYCNTNGASKPTCTFDDETSGMQGNGNAANTISVRSGKNGARQLFSSSWWEIEPDVGRVADGVADRVDRLKALGNGQVPAVVKAAWKLMI